MSLQRQLSVYSALFHHKGKEMNATATNYNIMRRIACSSELAARFTSRKDARKEQTQDEHGLTTVTAQHLRCAQTQQSMHKTNAQVDTGRVRTNKCHNS